MIENITKPLEIFSLNNKTDFQPALDAVMSGKITLLRVGSVFSFILNPNISGLIEKFNFLKERQSNQLMSSVCTYAKALEVVDKKRVNPDFFNLSEDFCSNVILRIPVDRKCSIPIPYNTTDGTMQFLSFQGASPARKDFAQKLAALGCDFVAITSGNIHGAPTIESVDDAKMLATLLNIKASFLAINDTQTVVTDIPEDSGKHKGSYVILSFCNPDTVEVKRFANKIDKDVTEKYLKQLLDTVQLKSKIEYVL